MVYPRMTYYTRVIDNATDDQIMGWVSSAKNRTLYYGRVNALYGGESENIIEFDIWNNEPGWDGGTPQTISLNAINCRMQIEIPSECRSISPFLYARCTTYDIKSEFEEVSMSHKIFKNIQGNASDEYGTILGVSDHATIQTKIKLRPNTTVNQRQFKFDLKFLYNYE